MKLLKVSINNSRTEQFPVLAPYLGGDGVFIIYASYIYQYDAVPGLSVGGFPQNDPSDETAWFYKTYTYIGTSVEEDLTSVKDFNLSQNYPNPFNPSTRISWQSPVSSWQSLKVYDVLGNEVATLVDEYRNAGSYKIDFNSSSLSSGIYFYRLTAGTFIQTKKMILHKIRRSIMFKYFLFLIALVPFTDLFSQVNQNRPDNVNSYIWAEGITENSQCDIFIAVPYGTGPFILKSTDQGSSWTTSDSGFIGWVEPEVMICDENDVVYFAGHGQSLYKSIDNGVSWERISPFGSAYDIYSLTITQNGDLFIGIFDGWERVFKTTDGGLTWQDCSAGINSYVNCLASYQNIIFVGTLLNGLLFSTDNGNSWEQTEFDSGTVKAVTFDELGTLYTNYNKNIFRSSNMGNTWTNIFSSPTLFWGKILPISESEIFIINENMIYRSLNSALSWDTISTFQDSINFYLYDIYFSSDSSLYLTTTDGIFTSSDLGNSWSEIDLGLTNIEDENQLVKIYQLSQNYPNPFNPSTKISWQSPVGSHQSLKVYDVLGNEVATLVDEYRNAGSYEIEFNPASSIKNPASGVYFYQLKAGEYLETKKMLLIK